jgi:hypothetical protein
VGRRSSIRRTHGFIVFLLYFCVSELDTFDFLVPSPALPSPQFPPPTLNMGRQKQTAPLQRTPSSNLMHLPNDSDVARNTANTDKPSVANRNVSEKASAALEAVADSPGLMQLVICVLGIYAALQVPPSRPNMNQQLTNTQPLMGSPTRGDHNNKLPNPPSNNRRTRATNRALHLLARSEHHPVLLRSNHRFYLPPDLNTKGPKHPIHFPHAPNPFPPAPSQHLFLARLALRLRKPPAHRLPNLYPRQIM